MENNNILIKTQTETESSGVQFKDLYRSVVKRWPWFIVSLMITIFLGCFYLVKTIPVYTRTASVLIKDSYNGTTVSSNLASFSELGLFQSNIDVNNEVIAFQSPSLMTNVVRNLDLEMSYYRIGMFRHSVLYGKSLPVKVVLPDAGDDDVLSFNLLVNKDSSLLISNILTFKDGEKIEYDTEFKGLLEDTIKTPVGKIIIKPSENFNLHEDIEILVSRSSLYSSVNKYSDKLSVELSAEKAAVINLILNDNSLERADDILNELISAYNNSWIEDKNMITKSTSEFINDRLEVIEKDLGIVDEDISSYRSKNLLPDLKAASSLYLEQNEETAKQILNLENQLYMAEYLKEYMSSSSDKFQVLPVNSGAVNLNIESQINDYNKLLLERNTIIANSSKENPLAVDMANSLSAMNKAIVSSINNQIVTIQNNLTGLKNSEKNINKRIAAGPGQAKYLVNIERQQKVKEALYLYLLQKREENELSQAFIAYNTRIIAKPNGSRSPTSPVRNKILLISIFMGFFIPCMIILILEYTNTKVRGRKDVENLAIPFLGEIPLYNNMRKKIGSSNRNYTDKTILVREGNRNIINEAFRMVRTNFDFILGKDENCKVSIVTSFNPGSGKSFISMNLASSFAIKGRKVLVIDGDMRHASSSAYVGLVKAGLSDYLARRVDNVDDIIVNVQKQDNFDILPVGTIPPNPTELLMEDRFGDLVQKLRTRYDYIFIDCPPYDIVADTQIISKLSDCTLFVIRTGLLERSMLREIDTLYKSKRFENMSLILNGSDAYNGQYGYRYGYHSKYYSDYYTSDKN